MSLDFIRKRWFWTQAVHFRIRIDFIYRLGENILKKISVVKEKLSKSELFGIAHCVFVILQERDIDHRSLMIDFRLNRTASAFPRSFPGVCRGL